jgi:multiple sugar transport system ATP-binding protein
VLKDGLLQQCAPPKDLFTRPVNRFVAGFIGSPAMNLMDGWVDADGAHLGGFSLALTPAQRSALTGDRITVGLRPEGVAVSDASSEGIEAVIDTVEELGSDAYLYCTAALAEPQQVVVREEGLSHWKANTAVRLRPGSGGLHLFDGLTGDRLPD